MRRWNLWFCVCDVESVDFIEMVFVASLDFAYLFFFFVDFLLPRFSAVRFDLIRFVVVVFLCFFFSVTENETIMEISVVDEYANTSFDNRFLYPLVTSTGMCSCNLNLLLRGIFICVCKRWWSTMFSTYEYIYLFLFPCSVFVVFIYANLNVENPNQWMK